MQKESVKNQKYDENSTSTVKKNDKDGTWTFSGWTATVEGTTVKVYWCMDIYSNPNYYLYCYI